ncbi:magnesium chelatase subunit D [Elioraea sp.]|uniref:magnesium chelatase subunit D n=1 Tax=Elioraea sp. TaxID=2185103 RepID=UPI0025C2B9B1|nr:magnesium chelatase subunit D [Elioraea sp.]
MQWIGLLNAPPAGDWADALLAISLFAVDPIGLKGIIIRSAPGPVRDRLLANVRRLLPPSDSFRKLPPGVVDGRLLGGLDLAATLKTGRPVAERGLLAESHGGVILLPMAERISSGLAARLGAVLDRGEVVAERDGIAIREAASLGMVLLDEGATDEEHPPRALSERIGFSICLDGTPLGATTPSDVTADDLRAARAIYPLVATPDGLIEALCETSLALGIASLRAPLLALNAARAAAALAGRPTVSDEDAAAAARLILGHRATRLPSSNSEDQQPTEQKQDSGDVPPPPEGSETDETRQPDSKELADLLLAAAAAALPPGLLAGLALGKSVRQASSAGKAGVTRFSARRGAPIGARPGTLDGGARLALLDTLRAAAPWQRLRYREGGPQIMVRRQDFRVKRFRERSETTTIFVVDASGSSAMNRLAEAKGAVELLLAECYVRRDRVALISFRGRAAELLLPPTNSLVRARRSLAALPGGGGTPIAAALDAARALADAVLRRGGTPLLVLLTDGRANVARDGTGGRETAEADALAAARPVSLMRIASVLLDTSPRPQVQASRLAAALGARYVPLPSADAAALSRAVRSAQPAVGGRAA